MIRSRKLLAVFGAALFGAVVLGAPSPANAAFKLFLQQAGINGGAITEVAMAADFSALSFTNSYGDFSITLLGSSSSNGSTTSDLLTSTTRVTNNAGSSRTLKIYVTQTNYTLPTGTPLNVRSSMGGSVNMGTLGSTGLFQAFADSGNAELGMSDFTNNPQDGVFTGTSYDTGSAQGLFNRSLGDPYSLTSVVTLTMSGFGQVGYQNQINVSAVPEPGTLAAAFTALPLLGGIYLRRRARRAV